MNQLTPEQEQKSLAMDLSIEMSFQLIKVGDMSPLAKKVDAYIIDLAGDELLPGGLLTDAIRTSLSDPNEAGRMLRRLGEKCIASYTEDNTADLREIFKREEVA